MTTVRIPSPLRRLTGGRPEVEVAASDVRAMVAGLDAAYPGLGGRLLDDRGSLHRHVHLFVGDEEVGSLDGLDTPLAPGDVVSIVPAVAGGDG